MSPIVYVEGNAYDPNISSQQQDLFDMGFEYINGQWVQTGGNNVLIQQAPPSVYTPTGAPSTGIPLTSSGIGNTAPGSMVNPLTTSSILGGAWTGFNPGDLGSGLAILRSYSQQVYGSVDLGVIRRSSEVLENEPSGIRPGTLERIVIPTWARRERGSPI